MMYVDITHCGCQSFVFNAFLLLLLVQQCFVFGWWMGEKDAKLTPAEKLMFEDEQLLVWCNLTATGRGKDPPLQLRIEFQNQLEDKKNIPRNESQISDGNVAVWVDINEFFFNASSGPDGNHIMCFDNETWITSESISVEHRIQKASDLKAVYFYDEGRLELNWTSVDETYFKPQMFVTTVDYVWNDANFVPGKPDILCSYVNGTSCIYPGLSCDKNTSSSCTIYGENYGKILFVRVNFELKEIWKNRRPDDQYLRNKADVYFASIVNKMDTKSIVKLSAPAQFQVNTTNATCIWIQWKLNDFFYSEESVLFHLETVNEGGTVKIIQSQFNITTDANTKPAIVRMCGFAEFTEYSVRLKVKADGGQGYWSDWTQPREATTLEDYPLEGPMIYPSGFFPQECKDDLRLVRVFWNEISRENLRGKFDHYKVNLVNSSFSRQVRLNFFDLSLPCNDSSEVSVSAVNGKGSSLTPAVFHIPAENKALSVDGSFSVAIEESLLVNETRDLNISWPVNTASSSANLRLVFYHCEESNPRTCYDSMDAAMVNFSDGHMTLNDVPGRHNMYGVGLSDWQGGVRGISWPDCVYLRENKPPTPNFRVVPGATSIQVLLLDKPCSRVTKTRTLAYHLVLCPGVVDQPGQGDCQYHRADASESSNTWTDLSPQAQYSVFMSAESHGGNGTLSRGQVVDTLAVNSSDLTPGETVAIVLGVLAVLAVALGIFGYARRCRKYNKLVATQFRDSTTDIIPKHITSHDKLSPSPRHRSVSNQDGLSSTQASPTHTDITMITPSTQGIHFPHPMITQEHPITHPARAATIGATNGATTGATIRATNVAPGTLVSVVSETEAMRPPNSSTIRRNDISVNPALGDRNNIRGARGQIGVMFNDKRAQGQGQVKPQIIQSAQVKQLETVLLQGTETFTNPRVMNPVKSGDDVMGVDERPSRSSDSQMLGASTSSDGLSGSNTSRTISDYLVHDQGSNSGQFGHNSVECSKGFGEHSSSEEPSSCDGYVDNNTSSQSGLTSFDESLPQSTDVLGNTNIRQADLVEPSQTILQGLNHRFGDRLPTELVVMMVPTADQPKINPYLPSELGQPTSLDGDKAIKNLEYSGNFNVIETQTRNNPNLREPKPLVDTSLSSPSNVLDNGYVDNRTISISSDSLSSIASDMLKENDNGYVFNLEVVGMETQLDNIKKETGSIDNCYGYQPSQDELTQEVSTDKIDLDFDNGYVEHVSHNALEIGSETSDNASIFSNGYAGHPPQTVHSYQPDAKTRENMEDHRKYLDMVGDHTVEQSASADSLTEARFKDDQRAKTGCTEIMTNNLGSSGGSDRGYSSKSSSLSAESLTNLEQTKKFIGRNDGYVSYEAGELAQTYRIDDANISREDDSDGNETYEKRSYQTVSYMNALSMKDKEQREENNGYIQNTNNIDMEEKTKPYSALPDLIPSHTLPIKSDYIDPSKLPNFEQLSSTVTKKNDSNLTDNGSLVCEESSNSKVLEERGKDKEDLKAKNNNQGFLNKNGYISDPTLINRVTDNINKDKSEGMQHNGYVSDSTMINRKADHINEERSDEIQVEEPTTKPSSEVMPHNGYVTDVPRSLHADVPRSAHADVPRSAHADVPRPAHADVPRSAHTDVPRSAHADVPRSAHTDVPRSAHADVTPSGNPLVRTSDGSNEFPVSSNIKASVDGYVAHMSDIVERESVASDHSPDRKVLSPLNMDNRVDRQVSQVSADEGFVGSPGNPNDTLSQKVTSPPKFCTKMFGNLAVSLPPDLLSSPTEEDYGIGSSSSNAEKFRFDLNGLMSDYVESQGGQNNCKEIGDSVV